MPGFDYSLRSVLARDYCSGTAASISHSNHYPYDRPAAGKKASQANSASSGQATFSQNSRPQLSGFMRTLNTVIEHLKHMKGAQQLWEVAVKRNGMTTSLALLGGVLVADTYLYPEGKKTRARQAVLQTNLAAAPAANSSSSSASSSSPSSGRQTVSHHAPGAAAHA